MNIIIRQIEEKDYEQTIRVIKRSITISQRKIYPKELLDKFSKKYDLENFTVKAKEITYFVAENKSLSQIIGVVGLKENALRTFFVDPDFQGMGIGRLLYNKLESVARSKGLTEIILEAGLLGIPVYEKFGFKKIKIIDKEKFGIHYRDTFMKKDLK